MRPLRILLIEDYPDDALLIADMLYGCFAEPDITTSETFSAGLKSTEEKEFDLVLLDLGLPDSIGLDALRKIQSKAPKLPIVIMTGRDDEETASEAISLGAQDYLVKGDFDRKLLQRSILYAIQRKQAQEALERAYDELELRVMERTADLSVVNTELTAEIAEHKVTEGALLKSNERMRDLAGYLQSVREEERKGIAREIHDELGQILTALKMDLFWIRSRLQEDQQQLSDKLQSDIELTENTIMAVKRICSELRPAILDHLGLEAALEWQCEEFQKRTNIKCVLEAKLETSITDENMKTAFFRIYQEVLTNVMRHSRASSVNARLFNSNGSVVLEVSDNGVGIEPDQLHKANSFGLLGMRERVSPWGGQVDIIGEKFLGTTVRAIIPVSRLG